MKAAPARVNPSIDLSLDTLAACGHERHVVHMTAKDKEREERLAAALRENLKRRKVQSRALNQKNDKSDC